MEINKSDIVQLVVGVMSDSGFSSKDNVKVVERAIDLYKEINYQVSNENARLKNLPGMSSGKKIENESKGPAATGTQTAATK